MLHTISPELRKQPCTCGFQERDWTICLPRENIFFWCSHQMHPAHESHCELWFWPLFWMASQGRIHSVYHTNFPSTWKATMDIFVAFRVDWTCDIARANAFFWCFTSNLSRTWKAAVNVFVASRSDQSKSVFHGKSTFFQWFTPDVSIKWIHFRALILVWLYFRFCMNGGLHRSFTPEWVESD